MTSSRVHLSLMSALSIAWDELPEALQFVVERPSGGAARVEVLLANYLRTQFEIAEVALGAAMALVS